MGFGASRYVRQSDVTMIEADNGDLSRRTVEAAQSDGASGCSCT